MSASSNASLEQLVGNAIDFLKRSLSDLEQLPKYSVINFYSAIELFLKARLLAEHWSLVISRKQEADLAKFRSGDFLSVTLDEAAERLAKVIQSPIGAAELKVFKSMGQHRNRMVHFYHEAANVQPSAELQRAIAAEQFTAWYGLNRLLLVNWEEIFKPWRAELDLMSEALKKHRPYLEATFRQIEAEITSQRAGGVQFTECRACEFEASKVVQVTGIIGQADCLVCGYASTVAEVKCPGCNEPLVLWGEAWDTCGECGLAITPQLLAPILDTDEPGTKDYYETGMPAHCVHCGDHRSVVHHGDDNRCVCSCCFTVYTEDDMRQCAYCGELNAGGTDNSYSTGCVACSGAYGGL